MKKHFLLLLSLVSSFSLFGQTTVVAPGEYKSVIITPSAPDYSRNLILLHEVYNGTFIQSNYAIGTITAIRGGAGAWNRLNVAEINSASAYANITANVSSIYNNEGPWKLKTCIYNGKKYLALDVPYNASYHDQGYKFTGWVRSTALSMISVTYQLNGAAVNQNLISDIQDFAANQAETHDVRVFNVLGNVGIGTVSPQEKLSVNGKIRAHEIKVETANWPDYVFEDNYRMMSLPELAGFIKKNKHLPEIPTAETAENDGVNLGEMNKKLLKKIEELTLYLIQKDEDIQLLKKQVQELQSKP